MPDTPLTDEQLAERIAEVIRPRMLIGLQGAELHDGPGAERINEWATSIARWAAEVMQPELDRLRAERDQARAQLADAKSAWRRLKTGLIATADRLDVPFSNAPEQSPWTRLKPVMLWLDSALNPKPTAEES